MSNKTEKKENTYFKNYDLYSDLDKSDTIRVKYATIKDLTETIKKLEKLYKKGERPHNRIVQVVNVMKQRLRVIVKNTGKGKNRLDLVSDYFDFLKDRTKVKTDKERKKMKYNI